MHFSGLRIVFSGMESVYKMDLKSILNVKCQGKKVLVTTSAHNLPAVGLGVFLFTVFCLTCLKFNG